MLLPFSEKNYYFSKPINLNQSQQPAKNVNLDWFPTTQILQPEPQTTTSEKSEKFCKIKPTSPLECALLVCSPDQGRIEHSCVILIVFFFPTSQNP